LNNCTRLKFNKQKKNIRKNNRIMCMVEPNKM
jgi:hypothetical protein